MSTLQVFLLGAMMSWTPSLVFLACLLWQAPLLETDEERSNFVFKKRRGLRARPRRQTRAP
jgi:hypothetical protein